MLFLRNDVYKDRAAENKERLRIPAPVFHKCLAPGPGPKEKRRILPESAPELRIPDHLWCRPSGTLKTGLLVSSFQ